ncbi:hypothetical protein IWX49DRAFT_9796 [Phyllosticta citricarpa]
MTYLGTSAVALLVWAREASVRRDGQDDDVRHRQLTAGEPQIRIDGLACLSSGCTRLIARQWLGNGRCSCPLRTVEKKAMDGWMDGWMR